MTSSFPGYTAVSNTAWTAVQDIKCFYLSSVEEHRFWNRLQKSGDLYAELKCDLLVLSQSVTGALNSHFRFLQTEEFTVLQYLTVYLHSFQHYLPLYLLFLYGSPLPLFQFIGIFFDGLHGLNLQAVTPHSFTAFFHHGQTIQALCNFFMPHRNLQI